MLNLPEFGSRVRVWPFPGRRVLRDPPPVLTAAGGAAHARFLAKGGELVTWTIFHLEQLRAGDVMLHPPPCEKHDHGDKGQDECCHCGRSVDEAQKYDVQFDEGAKAAAAASKSAPSAPALAK